MSSKCNDVYIGNTRFLHTIAIHGSTVLVFVLPVHSSVTSGRSSQSGRVPVGRKTTALSHSLEHTPSLRLTHSPLSVVWCIPLVSHRPKMWRQRKGLTRSKHSGVGLRKESPFIKVAEECSPSCWSMDAGMLSGIDGDTAPEKHVWNSRSSSVHISPEYGAVSSQA